MQPHQDPLIAALQVAITARRDFLALATARPNRAAAPAEKPPKTAPKPTRRGEGESPRERGHMSICEFLASRGEPNPSRSRVRSLASRVGAACRRAELATPEVRNFGRGPWVVVYPRHMLIAEYDKVLDRIIAEREKEPSK